MKILSLHCTCYVKFFCKCLHCCTHLFTLGVCMRYYFMIPKNVERFPHLVADHTKELNAMSI